MLELGLIRHEDSADEATSPFSPTPSFIPPPPEKLDELFPLIQVEALIGQGGMGAVYRGRQKKLDRQVAIKILPPEIGRDAAFAERFSREARALARLSHPNIVTIHDVGQAGEFYYFVMEYVDGTNLRELIRSGQVEPQQALAIVQQVCDALSYAHGIGIVHRDIKPENILVDRAGKVKIADFGLAKLVGADALDVSLTGSEQVMGTWRYMAPEQLEGSRDVDHRADIYSLGVVFYELLTGEVPMGRFRPPSEKVQVDVRVDEVVLKSLERERERRYQLASEVKTDVERCSSVSVGAKQGRPRSFSGERKSSRSRLVVFLLLLGGFVMAMLIMMFVIWWLSFAPPAGQAVTLDEAARIERAEELTGEGWSLWQQQKLAKAISKFEQATALDPQAPNAWNGLGWASFNSGRTEQGIAAFEKAVELEPDHPAALNGLGQAYLNYGEFKKAEKYLLKAAPQASAAAFGLGRLYLLTGKYAAAQKWLQKARGDQPNDPTLQQMLDAAKQKKLPDDLRRQLAPPGRQKQAESSAAAAQGWQRFNEGKLRSAEISFRRALTKDPEDASALNGLGFCLLTSGKWAEAKRYFAKCLEVDPEAAGAMNGLARCLKAEGKIDEAIATWEKMREKFPGPNAAAVGLATTYLERGDHAKAIPLYEELVAAMPDNEQFRQGLEAAREGAAKNEKQEN
jgi:Flp pilus assembly protein TadD/tRNA A-37 threonylcarbamoyl transferase component Bud32